MTPCWLVNSTTACETRSALASARRARRSRRPPRPRRLRQRPRPRASPCAGPSARRCQASPGNDHAELLDELLHRALQVLVEEELRVVEARAHNALVAGDDGIGDLRVGVRDDDELTGKLALGVENREIALLESMESQIISCGHAEELLVEGADEHGRPLAEVHDLVEYAGRRVHVAAGRSASIAAMPSRMAASRASTPSTYESLSTCS